MGFSFSADMTSPLSRRCLLTPSDGFQGHKVQRKDVRTMQARREVSELVSSMVEASGALPLPEDRLLSITEAAQVWRHCSLPHTLS